MVPAFHRLCFVKGPPGSRQLPFGPTHLWYTASYTKTTVRGGSGHISSLSCCLSAAAIRFLAVLFPPRMSASLTVGLPAAGLVHRTMTGFTCFTLLRRDRCRALPIPRDRGALMADIETSATTAVSQRRVLSFAVTFHLPKFWLTRLTGVHMIRPSGLPLAGNRWMEHRSLGFPPGLHTPPLPATHARSRDER